MSDKDDYPGVPRWVKVFGILGLLVIILFLIMMFRGGPHGPHRHGPPRDRAAAHAAGNYR